MTLLFDIHFRLRSDKLFNLGGGICKEDGEIKRVKSREKKTQPDSNAYEMSS